MAFLIVSLKYITPKHLRHYTSPVKNNILNITDIQSRRIISEFTYIMSEDVELSELSKIECRLCERALKVES